MDFNEALDRIIQFTEQAPDIVGNEAVNFFKDRFKEEGWEGESFEKWPPRKRETDRTAGKPVLRDTGALERSIQKKNTTRDSVTVGTAGQIPYARIHNEGGDIIRAPRSETIVRQRFVRGSKRGKFKKGTKKGKGFTFRKYTTHIPKRQFMGDSPKLRDGIRQKLVTMMEEALKK